MSTRIFLRSLALLCCLSGFALGQDWAKPRLEKSPRHLEWVTIRHGNREVRCWVAYPEVKEKATAVVVIHEIFGLTDWVRGVADQLAEAGYIAIAPDLLSGAGPNGGGTESLGGPDGARSKIGSLSPDQVTADLKAACDYVQKLPACNGKVAVGGFCWGGTQTFRFVSQHTGVKAGFVFYGSGSDDERDLAKIHAPVYGFYGGNDARVNATLPKSETLMKKAGKVFEPVLYEGAGHGFMRAGEDPAGSPENKKAREAAWQRIKQLLKGV
jgi:carboxymethylenebutenolidase